MHIFRNNLKHHSRSSLCAFVFQFSSSIITVSKFFNTRLIPFAFFFQPRFRKPSALRCLLSVMYTFQRRVYNPTLQMMLLYHLWLRLNRVFLFYFYILYNFILHYRLHTNVVTYISISVRLICRFPFLYIQ